MLPWALATISSSAAPRNTMLTLQNGLNPGGMVRTDQTYAQAACAAHPGSDGRRQHRRILSKTTVLNDWATRTGNTGGAGDDLFYASTLTGYKDKVTDKTSKETIVAL